MLLNSSHIAACLLSHGWLCNPWTVARHTALSMEFSGKYTGVGCHFLLHQIFQTQGLNSPFLRLQHWQADCLPQSHQGNSYYCPSNPCLTLKAIYENIISECVTPTTHYTSFKYSHYFQPWTHSLTPFFFYSGLLCSFSHWQYFGNILLLKHAPFPGGFFSYPIKLIFSFSESSVFLWDFPVLTWDIAPLLPILDDEQVDHTPLYFCVAVLLICLFLWSFYRTTCDFCSSLYITYSWFLLHQHY